MGKIQAAHKSSETSSVSRKAAPSLRSRLLLGGGLIVLLSMSVVGLVLDKAFAAATRESIQERLENTIFLLLATIQTDQEAFGLDQLLPDDRLEQTGSGLYAGILTEAFSWRSHSALAEPEFVQDMLAPGEARFINVRGEEGRFVLSMGLAWVNEDGSELAMTAWAAQHRDEYVRQMRIYRRALWPWLGAVSVLIMAMQWLGMWLGIRPLREIEAQVKAVESGQAERLEGRYPLELKPLTDNVNALLATERANRERYRKSLGDLAHSLKTPLAVLQGLFSDHELDASAIDTARGAVHDMRETISRQLERAASATRRTHVRPVSVAAVVQRLCQVLDKVYAQRNIKCIIEVDASTQFFGEERDLMEICGNLIENAYKYGAGQVVVHAHNSAMESRRPGLFIEVSDNGPGIAAEEFSRLLRRGERGDQQVEGQGLGLAIVAELVHAYDAQIQVRSSPLGGAALRIEIPAL